MKKYILGLFLLVFLFNSCEQTSVFDGLEIITNTAEIAHTSVSIIVYNAKTGEPMGAEGEIVRARIRGVNAGDVFDITGKQKNVYEFSKGSASFGVYTDQVPSVENPIVFNIMIESPGFLATSIPVRVYEKGRTMEEVSMVKYTDTPSGVAYKGTTMEAENGVLASAVTLISDEVEGTNTKATLTAPAGLIVKDKDGNLLGNELTTRMVYFNNESETMSAYPGGLVAEVEGNGDESSIEFYSAGFVAITIKDENGKQARFFDNGTLDVEIEIDPNTYNHETGTNVVAGDIIPTWSYEVDEGIWTREADVEITEKEGKLVSKAKFSHLSYWNWDWPGPRCTYGTNLCIKSNFYPLGTPIQFRLIIIRASDGAVRKNKLFNKRIGDCIPLLYAPLYQEVIVRSVHQFNCEANTQETTLFGACGESQDIYIDPQNIDASDIARVSVHFDGYCPNDDITIKPTFPFLYENITDPCDGTQYMGAFENGFTETMLKKGDSYRFSVFYDGNNVERVINVPNGPFDDLDWEFEDISFGTGMCDFFQ